MIEIRHTLVKSSGPPDSSSAEDNPILNEAFIDEDKEIFTRIGFWAWFKIYLRYGFLLVEKVCPYLW